jgi:hypothetical protein
VCPRLTRRSRAPERPPELLPILLYFLSLSLSRCCCSWSRPPWPSGAPAAAAAPNAPSTATSAACTTDSATLSTHSRSPLLLPQPSRHHNCLGFGLHLPKQTTESPPSPHATPSAPLAYGRSSPEHCHRLSPLSRAASARGQPAIGVSEGITTFLGCTHDRVCPRPAVAVGDRLVTGMADRSRLPCSRCLGEEERERTVSPSSSFSMTDGPN